MLEIACMRVRADLRAHVCVCVCGASESKCEGEDWGKGSRMGMPKGARACEDILVRKLPASVSRRREYVRMGWGLGWLRSAHMSEFVFKCLNCGRTCLLVHALPIVPSSYIICLE